MKEGVEFVQFRGVWVLVCKIVQKLHEEELVLFGADRSLKPLFLSMKLLSDTALVLGSEESLHCRVVERAFERDQPLAKLRISFRSFIQERGKWDPQSPKLSIDFDLLPWNKLLSEFCWVISRELRSEVSSDPSVRKLIFS